MTLRLIMAAHLVAACGVLISGTASAAEGENCSITATCCSADAGYCELGKTCSCSFSCGAGIARCGCQCVAGGGGYTYNLSKKLALNYSNFGWSLGTNSAGLTLGDIGNFLQSVVNWRIDVDPTIAGTVAPSGTWSGTMQSVVEQFTTAAGASVSFDDPNSTITISE